MNTSEIEKTEPCALKIRLFGRFGAWLNGAHLVGLHKREGERVLAYLALHANEPVSHADLARVFWPSEFVAAVDGHGSYHSTRQAMYSLRLALGAAAHKLESVGKGVVKFNLEPAEVDVLQFDTWVASNDPTLWAKAKELHNASLLCDFQDAWVVAQRNRRVRSMERICRLLTDTKDIAKSAVAPSVASVRSQMQATPPGGAMPLNSTVYVSRPADIEVTGAISSEVSMVLITGPIMTGKSSLLARALQTSRNQNLKTVLTDFSSLGSEVFASPETLYRAIVMSLASQLDIKFSKDTHWTVDLSPALNLEMFVRRNVLAKAASGIVWGMDDVDQLLGKSYSDEFFALLRSWHNKRALDPESSWNRLTIIMTYASDAITLVRDPDLSPFNVGMSVRICCLDRNQLGDLNINMGSPLAEESALDRLYELVAGHPFMAHAALHAIIKNGYSIEQIANERDLTHTLFARYLRRAMARLAKDPLAREAARAVASGTAASREGTKRLIGAGIGFIQPGKSEPVIGELMKRYLAADLPEANYPDREWTS